jgi:transcriptional regulator with GAF, ATPase, and Fis domain
MPDKDDSQELLLKKGEEFLKLYNMGKQFTEELLKENERLRYRVALLEEQQGGTHSNNLNKEIARLRERIGEIEEENHRILEKYQQVEAENKDFATRYVEVEEQNNNLANLYVASYQLHSTLDFQEVLQIVIEIVINLIGSEAFAIFLLDEKTNELKALGHEGTDIFPGMENLVVKVGDGTIGGVVKTGESYFVNQSPADARVDLHNPLAAVPLKIKEHVIGALVIYSLLKQKSSFSAVDYELFNLLAGQAATAIFASKLYSQSERKLSTIQSFLDLLTTTG